MLSSLFYLTLVVCTVLSEEQNDHCKSNIMFKKRAKYCELEVSSKRVVEGKRDFHFLCCFCSFLNIQTRPLESFFSLSIAIVFLIRFFNFLPFACTLDVSWKEREKILLCTVFPSFETNCPKVLNYYYSLRRFFKFYFKVYRKIYYYTYLHDTIHCFRRQYSPVCIRETRKNLNILLRIFSTHNQISEIVTSYTY